MIWRLGRLFLSSWGQCSRSIWRWASGNDWQSSCAYCVGSPAAGTIHQRLDDDRDTEELEFIFAWLICFVYSQGVNLSSMIPQNGFSPSWAVYL